MAGYRVIGFRSQATSYRLLKEDVGCQVVKRCGRGEVNQRLNPPEVSGGDPVDLLKNNKKNKKNRVPWQADFLPPTTR